MTAVVQALENISLNITGLYNPNPSNAEICELNQFAMLENVQKFPKVMFYFALTSFIVLAFYIYILPRIKFKNNDVGKIIQSSLPMLSLGLMVWALIFAYFTTWSVDITTWKSWEPFMKIGIGIGILAIIYGYRDKLKEIWVGLKKVDLKDIGDNEPDKNNKVYIQPNTENKKKDGD